MTEFTEDGKTYILVKNLSHSSCIGCAFDAYGDPCTDMDNSPALYCTGNKNWNIKKDTDDKPND